MSTSSKPRPALKTRLVATYWIDNPGKWAETFGKGAKKQKDHTIHVIRMKLKYRPRHNKRYPYFVSLTAEIGNKSKAIVYMEQQRAIADNIGVDMKSVTNCWYETTNDCDCDG